MTHRRHLAPLRGWDWQFDQGSAASIADDAGKIRITPYISAYGKWGWWAIRSDRLGGTTPHFVIAKADSYSVMAGMWLACWATRPDTDTWNQFDNASIGASDIEFYNNAPFPNGTIYIAALPMYPFARVQRKMLDWKRYTYVSALPDAGQASRRIAGEVCPALPFMSFKLSSGAGTKNNIILTTLNHATETPGAYAFEGAIDWLLGGSVLAEFLLDYCNFYVYPATNPQGVEAGWFRSSPQVPGTSHDWLWDAGSTGTDESVDAFKTAMTADTTAIEVGFDYHAYYSNTDIHGEAHTGDTGGNYAVFTSEMAALDADFNLDNMDLSKASAVFFKSLSASLGLAIEQGMETGRSVAEWKTFGRQTMQALANMLKKGYFTNNPGVGSRDFNGTTDRIDWANVADLKDHALTISLWVYLDAIPANGYLFCIHQSGDTAVAMYFNVSHTSGDFVSFGVLGATNMQRASDANNPTTGAWINYSVTWDGVITNATGVHIYKTGTECASYSVTTDGATSVTATGKWSLGGRYYDDARNMDGKIAQVGVWNRVLTATEIANLAAGYAPDLAAASGLQFYFKGNTSSLANSVSGGANGTADGTTQVTGVGNGPSIVY